MPSYEAVMDMTLLEFKLRREGFERSNRVEWEKTRFISFHAIAGTGALKKGTTLEQFLPLNNNPKSKGRISDAMKNAFQIAQDNYLKEVNGSRT